MQVDYKLIGSRIKEQRRARGYTQEVLAERLDVSVGYVSQVERGITRISLDLLAAISSALECDMAVLVTGSAMDSDGYMQDEIWHRIAQMTCKEKQLVLGFMELLLRNRG